MSCTYTYQGKTYNAWEFADVLASMPLNELIKYLPEDAVNQLAMASFAGEKSLTADVYSLGSAKQRLDAGEDAETVRNETGWFKGADGKWRYEINDSDASLKKPYPSKGQRWGDVWKSQLPEGSTLGKMIDHPALFAAYPALADIPVSSKNGTGASYSVQSRQIDLGEDVPMYDALSILLHEIQHGIQNIEGFATGGSERGMTGSYLDDKARIEDLERKMTRYENMYSDEASYAGEDVKAAAIEWAKEAGEFFESAPIEEKVKDYLLYKDPLYNDWYKEHAELKYKKIRINPRERYRRLAGEVEARNTQSRMNMTADERRNTSPESTQDVANSDVIVVFNGKEMASSPAPMNAESVKELPETITVDGVERPTRNSNGKPIYPTEEGIRNFWRWFSDSKVVDKNGRPLVMYHGTAADFTEFDTNKGIKGWSEGAWFTVSKSNQYAVSDGSMMIPVYLSIKNPKVMRHANDGFNKTELEAGGFDGVLDLSISKQPYIAVAFQSNQIKSATGNNGNFDGANPSIQASISFSPNAYRERLQNSDSLMANKIGNFIERMTGDSASQFGWLHKTISTQFQKARKNHYFGRVYNSAQSFIEDVAKYASESADMAPGIIPKMDSIKDAFKDIRYAKQSKEDQAKIAKPIFEGTLDYMRDEQGQLRKTDNVDEAGVVFSDTELRQLFGLNDRQIGLYRQFRLAVDQSLEKMAIAEMKKVAKANTLYMPTEEMNMWQTANFFRKQYADELEDLRTKYDERLKVYEATEAEMRRNAGKPGMKLSYAEYTDGMNKMKAEFEAEHRMIFRQIEQLENLEKAFEGRAQTVDNMKKKGYAPLTRFGKYTVDAVVKKPMLGDDARPLIDQETGEPLTKDERVFFSMYENDQEAREAQRALQAEYPDAEVKRGVMSQDSYQLFGSMNEGTLEALKNLVGDEDKVMQEFYKNAVSNRSALKRLIHRQGIKGYSEDVTRTLASFLLSNARASAAADHFGDMVEAAMNIPKVQGDVADEAVKLINYIRNPNEEAGFARGMLFIQFLGGSVASAAVNLTQTMTTTLPFLHQFGIKVTDLIDAGKLAGQRMAGKAVLQDQDLAKALRLAEDEGVLKPHNIHVMMGQSGIQSFTNNPYWRMFTQVWGSFFGMAEQYNREAAFIAAYKLAQKIGPSGLRRLYEEQSVLYAKKGLAQPDRKFFSSPFEFAKNAVDETQFVISKAARPNWARGPIGATLFTFQQFKVFYIELFSRLPRKEQAIMLAVLVMMAGLSGLPFEDDLEDLIDTLGQAMGYKTNTEKWKSELLAEYLGPLGEFANTGISSFMPFDVASRMGMGNMIPATGALKKSNSGNHQRDMEEMLGAAGGMFKQLTEAWDYSLKGQYGKAIAYAAAPKAIKDLVKGVDMANTGVYEDTRGRRVTDVSMSDAFWKAIGFQPTAVSKIQRIKGAEMQDIALVKTVKASIAEIWAEGMHDQDAGKSAQARAMIEEWNAKNPEAKIKIDRSAVLRRVREMKRTAQERLVKTSPKEMRSQVKAAFTEK